MNCKVCGSSEFVTNDGITYCTECQSQIEETQTEVAVELTFSRDIGSTGPKKKPTQKKKPQYDDWVTIECFNHILCMQVSSLIKLGASPKLKSTVLHIWSKYLQKCEIAFRTDYLAKAGKPLLGSAPFKRDLKVLYGNKQICKRPQKRKKPEESDGEISANPSADEAPLSEDTGTESETNANVEVSTENNHSKTKFSSHARKMLRKKKLTRHNRIKQVFNMTLAKTLSICYLGLLYTEDQLSLCDLIRFAFEEKVPYINLIDKLSTTLKLQVGDRVTFLTYTVPDAFSILRTSREIMRFINLPDYKEPSVYVAAARLVKDFNLPGDVMPIIKTLTERYKEEISHYAKAPKIENVPHEYIALSSLVVALKMLFILDDKFEIDHSKVMKKLNALYPDKKYFEWKEWKEHSMVKEFLFLCEKPGYSAVNNLDRLSANLIISKYPFTRLVSAAEDDSKKSQDITLAKHKINKVLSDIVHIPISNSNVPTSFPLRRAVKRFVEDWRNLPMFKETKEIDFTLLEKDFSSYSLSFNPLQFDEVEDELSYLLMTSLYLPDTTANVESTYFSPITNHHKVICTTSGYWFLNFEKNYGTSDITSDWLDKLPGSFKWLVNFFSKYAYCNSATLYKEIVQIEKILFLRKRLIRSNADIKNKINVDF